MRSRRAGSAIASVSLAAMCLILPGCDERSGSSRPPTGPSPVVGPTPPSPPEPSERTVRLGEPITGTIDAASRCKFAAADTPFADLCHVFTVTAPEDGTLVAQVRVTADAALVLRFRTATGEIVDAFCCAQTTARLPVRAGSLMQTELAYTGRPSGYPLIQPVDYTIELSLLVGDAQRGKVQAIVFGDDTRTQRLPDARLEVVDGPMAGRIARFDERSGLYELADLPAGFVRLHVSAPGFASKDEEVVIGAQLAREITLQRTVPLIEATRTLTGIVAAPGSNAFLVGAKIEILDGPLAGVFALTDDLMAIYLLRSLPAGLIHVRATHGDMTQTVSVDLSAATTGLNFRLERK